MQEHNEINLKAEAASGLPIHLSAHGVEVSGELRDFVNRRAHFGLGRFATRIRNISVRLADVNGPKGGLDKCCDIRVDAGLPAEVVVHERQSSLYSAVGLAMERAGRALKRRISVAKEVPRGSCRTGFSLS